VYSDIIQWQNSRSLIALPDGEFDGAFIGSNRMGHVQRAGRYVPPANVAIPWSLSLTENAIYGGPHRPGRQVKQRGTGSEHITVSQ